MSDKNKPNEAELAQIWATLILILAQIQHLVLAHILYDGICVVHSCLPNLGHKQAIGRQHVSHENK